MGEDPKRIDLIIEDIECHDWELKLNYFNNEKLLKGSKKCYGFRTPG